MRKNLRDLNIKTKKSPYSPNISTIVKTGKRINCLDTGIKDN